MEEQPAETGADDRNSSRSETARRIGAGAGRNKYVVPQIRLRQAIEKTLDDDPDAGGVLSRCCVYEKRHLAGSAMFSLPVILAAAMILVHDNLLAMRGAERTFMAMCDMYPQAPIATLLYDSQVFGDRLSDRQIHTSRYQRLRANQQTFRVLLPVFPRAVAGLPVGGHDVVVSSSYAFAHGVRPDPDAIHVCYCHTPFRYAWYARSHGLAQAPRMLRPLVGRSLDRIQRWDFEVAQRNTFYIANAPITQERLQSYWKRDAPVVYPPVELARFRAGEPEDFFLVVGEMVRHKQFEVALEAARRANVPIKAVGSGIDEARLRERYDGHAEFLGRVDDQALADLYSRSKALVMCNIEEFGITGVEAQASGRPVIAADGGGARETVIEGETGLFYPHGDADALAKAMRSPLLDEMEPERAVANAQRFSVEAFQRGIAEQVEAARAAV